MKGLLKDNFYAAYANEKIWFAVMFLLGIVAAAVIPDGSIFIRNYMMICLVGFSYVALGSLRKDDTCKWEKYKLTVPVTRADIVKSCYAGQLIWLAAGVLFGSVPVVLYIVMHGYPFDLSTDIWLIYMLGMSISFFMDGIFFPLYYLFGTEKKDVSLFVSILSAVAAIVGLIALLNYLFGPGMTERQILLSGLVMLSCAVLVFGLSYLITVGIFSRKEY